MATYGYAIVSLLAVAWHIHGGPMPVSGQSHASPHASYIPIPYHHHHVALSWQFRVPIPPSGTAMGVPRKPMSVHERVWHCHGTAMEKPDIMVHLCPDGIETEGSHINLETDADFAKGSAVVGHGGQRPHTQLFIGCYCSGDILNESLRRSLPWDIAISTADLCTDAKAKQRMRARQGSLIFADLPPTTMFTAIA